MKILIPPSEGKSKENATNIAFGKTEFLYKNEIKSFLAENLKISNSMRIPKLVKISINMGFGQARLNENQLKAAVEELGDCADYAITNVIEEDSVKAAIDKTVQNFGAVNILVYCAGGFRSALAAKTLSDMGFHNVYNICLLYTSPSPRD